MKKLLIYKDQPTKESIIKKTYGSENLPSPLFAKEGDYSSLLHPSRKGEGKF